MQEVPMPAPNPAAIEFLSTRRSRPARTLTAPAPDRAALTPILTAALRVPDHGKLEPWRLIVLERAALDRLAALAGDRAAALSLDPEQAAKGIGQFAASPLCVAVVESPVDQPKIPAIEQTYSAGCVALGLVNAALAAGWGACWLTGWPAYDDGILTQGLGLRAGERLVGFVHIGTETSAPPERPRPDLAARVTWADA
jgi:nitroreductase